MDTGIGMDAEKDTNMDFNIADSQYYQDAYGGQQVVREADVEVITAVPLSVKQRQIIEIRLIRMMKNPVALKLTVDPTLLGGVRIVTEKIVIDDSIKRKLFDMKHSMTERVFLAD